MRPMCMCSCDSHMAFFASPYGKSGNDDMETDVPLQVNLWFQPIRFNALVEDDVTAWSFPIQQ